MSTYDVIVIGAGTAGIPAAVEAAARGLNVALIEAADDIGGTLHLSTASISAAGTSIQARSGIEDSVEDHYADYLRINHGTGERALVRSWIENAAEAVEWLQSIGWAAEPDTAVFAMEHDLYTVPRTYRSKDLGLGVVAAYRVALARAVERDGLQVMTGTRFTGLLTEDGRITGIRTDRGGEAIDLSARAVIVTTGGFSASERHWDAFYGFNPLRYGIPTAQGDGIDAVRAIGGSSWFDDYLLPNFGATREVGGPPSAWIHSSILPTLRPPWEIYVNLEGQRFMCEDDTHIFARELAVRAQTDWGFWVVYDEGIREAAPPFLRMAPQVAEAKFAGADEDFVRADSIGALAQGMKIPESTLAQTVAFYNAGQDVGSDMLGRKHMPLPLGKAPFYAVRHYGYAISSYPGIRVDGALRVLGGDGQPIEGLYAAGEAIGIGFLGLGFMSGSIVSSAITFGLKLGREVLAEVPA
jgi:fumarate reductase flavoprotein subunit